MFFKAIQVVDRFDFRIIPIGIHDGIYFDRHLPIKTIDNLDEANSQSLSDACEQIENGLQDFSTETSS